MSDFDKEAERERLREKFARDEEKRADTKRMSELLLKGATMTNRHCDTCGDPIFRYEGREFCPTCQSREAGAAETAAAEGADAESAAAETATEAADAEPPAASTETPPVPDRDSAASSPETAAPAESDAGSEGTSAGGAETRPEPAPAARGDTNGRSAGDVGRAPTRATDGTEDLGEARASLVRTLTTHAAAAESASDPRVATDHLEAARTAAETLRALDGR